MIKEAFVLIDDLVRTQGYSIDKKAWQTLKAAVLAQQTNNNARDEICGEIIESAYICSYCKQRNDVDSKMCDKNGGYGCFIGRKLSPVA